MDRVVWVAASPRGDSDDVRSVVSAALEVGFDEIVLFQPDASLQRLGRFSPILLKDSTFFLGDVEVGRLATIRSAKDEAPVRGLRGATKNVVIRPEPWKVIPLENLIAFFQGSGTRLLVEVHDVTEAKLAFETMEVGAGGIFLTTSSRTEIRAVRALLESFQQDIRLVRAKITGTRGLGLGDRVCVDTCSLLRRGEGLLVGNTSAGLFLIHAETIETGEVAARPFRVNAGPVHAYIYLPGGTTKYLSELRAGDDILAVDSEGRARSVVIGRVKIERRPLLLVEAEANDRRYSTIVQNAETVRFVTSDGGSVGVSEIRVGDGVLLRLEEGCPPVCVDGRNLRPAVRLRRRRARGGWRRTRCPCPRRPRPWYEGHCIPPLRRGRGSPSSVRDSRGLCRPRRHRQGRDPRGRLRGRDPTDRRRACEDRSASPDDPDRDRPSGDGHARTRRCA